jgi:DNA-binding beta-propeller fold protein YncE
VHYKHRCSGPRVTRSIPTLLLFLFSLAARAAAADEAALPLRSIADIPLTGKASRLDYQALDPNTHLLFIAHLGDGVVHVVDVEKQRVVADIPDVAKVHGIVVVPELGRAYASATGSKEIVAIDEKTLRIEARIRGEGYPDGLAYDPASLKLYVSDEAGGQEVVIDMRENRRVATIAVGGEAGNTQYDTASGHIFVNVQTTGEIVEIDPKTDKVTRRPKVEGADGNHGLLIYAERRLAFAACQGNSTLIVLDMRLWKPLARFPIGRGNDVLAFDPGLRRLYVSSESGVVSIFEVGSAKEPKSQAVTKLAEAVLAPNAHTVAVDPATHRVYFPLENVGGKPVLRVFDATVAIQR